MRAEPKTVAVAGATGNAGLEVVRALLDRGHAVRALVRDPQKLGDLRRRVEVREVQLTARESVRGVLDGADWLVSALGKTWQKGGPPRRTVDVDANLGLLEEAAIAGVRRFGFVSVATARPDHPVAMVRMKGEVEHAIEASGIPFVIFQPTGFFSDMWEMLRTCRKGTLWAFGDGRMRFNPIALPDLGAFVADAMDEQERLCQRLPVGGPDTFDSFELARVISRVLGHPVKVRRVPLWLARSGVAMLRPFSRNLWEMGDFFVGNAEYARRHLGNDASVQAVGHRRLEDYLRSRLAGDSEAAVGATMAPCEEAANGGS